MERGMFIAAINQTGHALRESGFLRDPENISKKQEGDGDGGGGFIADSSRAYIVKDIYSPEIIVKSNVSF